MTRLRAVFAALVFLALACAEKPEEERPDERLVGVRALQDEGKFAESLAPLYAILQAKPADAEANHRLGLALLRAGHPSRAVWPLRRASESEEYAVESGTLLGGVFLQSRNFEEAIRAADRVLAVDGTNGAALRMRARARLAGNQYAEGLADADRVLAAEPDDQDALALRASALVGLERMQEAEQVHVRLRETVEASADEGVRARGCAVFANFYAQFKKDAEQAANLFRECVERFPADVFVLQVASAFFDGREERETTTSFWRNALEKAPENLFVRGTLAGRLEEDGELKEADALLVEGTRAGDPAAAWQMLADFHQRNGDLAAAEAALAQASAAGGEQSELHRFTRADLLVASGQIDRAEEVAAGLSDPTLRDLLRARILAARGQYSEAMAAFDAGIPSWPNNAGARFLAGQTAELMGDFERALAEYHAAVRADKKGTDAALAAARLHLALGEPEAALQLAQFQMSFRPTPQPLAAAVAARAATALGRYEAARRLAQHIAESDNGAQAAAIELAAVEREAAGPQAAVQAIEGSGLDLTDPANEAALRAVVGDLLAVDATDRALEKIDAAIERTPDAAWLRDVRGRVLLNADRTEEARVSFEKALAVGGDYGPALTGLATLAARRGDTDEAVALFDKAAAVDPASVESRYHAAQVLLGAGRNAEAEERLEALVKAAPWHAEACNDLAWLLSDQGKDLDRALALATRASRLAPSSFTFGTLGLVELARGDAAAAAASFEKALAEGASADTLYRLGLAREAAGDVAGALAAYREALASAPFADAEDARLRVSRLEAKAAAAGSARE